MTTITTIDLTTLNAASLKTLARDMKVKNWWKLNKEALLTALTEVQEKYRQAEKSFAGAEAEAKKATKKAKKTPKTEEELENLVTVKELAIEFGMKSTKARRLLRHAFGLASDTAKTRWEWEKGSEELEKVRSILEAKASVKEAK